MLEWSGMGKDWTDQRMYERLKGVTGTIGQIYQDILNSSRIYFYIHSKKETGKKI